jgi:hypothetical protein
MKKNAFPQAILMFLMLLNAAVMAQVQAKDAVVPGMTITTLTEVSALGFTVVSELSSVMLKPYEVKFIEVAF